MRKFKRIFTMLLVAGLLALMMTPAWAATEAQKQAAIDSGLAWLAAQQSTTSGAWGNSQGYPDATTASALLAFTEQYTKPAGWNGQDYSTVVTKAANYLLNSAGSIDISSGPWFAPVSNPVPNTKTGLIWGGAESTYVSGLVLPALTRYAQVFSGTGASMPVAVTNPVVTGLTYGQVIQKTVDMFVWGQNGPASGNADGGWRYTPRTGQSDQSTAQWPAIGMAFAQGAGAIIPAQTKTELINWMKYIQNADANNNNGGAGYDAPWGGGAPISESKTGGLLVQMDFTDHDTAIDGKPGKAGALAYLNRNWLNGAGLWDGNFGHPYAMWSIYKGLESTIGLGDTAAITNIHQLSYYPGATIDSGDTWNWWEDYSQFIVSNQTTPGYWNGVNYWDSVLATSWNINILNATALPPPPGVPEPATMLLLGLGLLGLAGIKRRFK